MQPYHFFAKYIIVKLLQIFQGKEILSYAKSTNRIYRRINYIKY